MYLAVMTDDLGRTTNKETSVRLTAFLLELSWQGVCVCVCVCVHVGLISPSPSLSFS